MGFINADFPLNSAPTLPPKKTPETVADLQTRPLLLARPMKTPEPAANQTQTCRANPGTSQWGKPSAIPIHWQEEVKAGLDRDIRLGVLEARSPACPCWPQSPEMVGMWGVIGLWIWLGMSMVWRRE